MAKRTCDICGRPIVMKEPGALWFHTDLEAKQTFAWHMACVNATLKRGTP